MKKLLTLIVAIILIITLSGCGSSLELETINNFDSCELTDKTVGTGSVVKCELESNDVYYSYEAYLDILNGNELSEVDRINGVYYLCHEDECDIVYTKEQVDELILELEQRIEELEID